MKTQKISAFIILTLWVGALNGQVRQPHSLYYMETIPQISQMNPAFQPRANGYLSLPVNFNIDLFSDLAPKDIFQRQGNNWYTPFDEPFDFYKLKQSIGKNSFSLNGGLDLDIIGYGLRVGKGYLSIGVSEHITGSLSLPTDLITLADDKYPNGTTLDFSPLGINSMMYQQFRIGYSHKITDRLTVGMNIKPLFGQIAVVTDLEKFSFLTGEEQWNLDAKGAVYSSLPYEAVKNEEGKLDEFASRVDDYEFIDWFNDYGGAFRNPGIAFDLGASYRITDQLTVSASLNNLGFISWKEDLNSVSFSGKYTFESLEFDDTEDVVDQLEELLNSINDATDYKMHQNKFKTTLPPALHAGVSYQFFESLSAGFLSRTVFWKNSVSQSFNLSGYFQPYSFFALNAGATWQVKGSVYLGGGFTFLLGPLQFYLLSDFIPVSFTTVRVEDMDEFPIVERPKSLTMRIGLNLIFGRHGYTNKPMLEKRKNVWN